jgi:hypothetical protein
VQVNRSNEPRGDPVVASTDDDKAFVAELVQMVTDWLAGRPPSPTSSAVASQLAAADAATAMQEDTMGSGPDEQEPAAAAVGQQQQQDWQELALPLLNSYKRLLAYQELRKPQFGVEGHPGFWVKKVRLTGHT